MVEGGGIGARMRGAIKGAAHGVGAKAGGIGEAIGSHLPHQTPDSSSKPFVTVTVDNGKRRFEPSQSDPLDVLKPPTTSTPDTSAAKAPETVPAKPLTDRIKDALKPENTAGKLDHIAMTDDQINAEAQTRFNTLIAEKGAANVDDKTELPSLIKQIKEEQERLKQSLEKARLVAGQAQSMAEDGSVENPSTHQKEYLQVQDLVDALKATHTPEANALAQDVEVSGWVIDPTNPNQPMDRLTYIKTQVDNQNRDGKMTLEQKKEAAIAWGQDFDRNAKFMRSPEQIAQEKAASSNKTPDQAAAEQKLTPQEELDDSLTALDEMDRLLNNDELLKDKKTAAVVYNAIAMIKLARYPGSIKDFAGLPWRLHFTRSTLRYAYDTLKTVKIKGKTVSDSLKPESKTSIEGLVSGNQGAKDYQAEVVQYMKNLLEIQGQWNPAMEQLFNTENFAMTAMTTLTATMPGSHVDTVLEGNHFIKKNNLQKAMKPNVKPIRQAIFGDWKPEQDEHFYKMAGLYVKERKGLIGFLQKYGKSSGGIFFMMMLMKLDEYLNTGVTSGQSGGAAGPG